jgi:hypothetical protein
MSNPFRATTTVDIYWTTGHDGTPDVANVPCTLVSAWEDGQAHGTRNVPAMMYTHVMHLDQNIDKRDIYIGAMQPDPVLNPYVRIPTGGRGTSYTVSFVERVNQ